jgi:hypothetical protein
LIQQNAGRPIAPRLSDAASLRASATATTKAAKVQILDGHRVKMMCQPRTDLVQLRLSAARNASLNPTQACPHPPPPFRPLLAARQGAASDPLGCRIGCALTWHIHCHSIGPHG